MWPRHLYDILHHTHCSLGTLEQRFSNKQRPCTPWSCKFHPVRWRQVHTVTVNMHLLRPSDLQKQHGGPMLDTYFSGLRALKEHRSSMVDTYLFQVPAYGNFPGTRTKRVHGPTGICIYIFHESTYTTFVCMKLYSHTETVYDQPLQEVYFWNQPRQEYLQYLLTQLHAASSRFVPLYGCAVQYKSRHLSHLAVWWNRQDDIIQHETGQFQFNLGNLWIVAVCVLKLASGR